jgi:hypothetical protein
MSKTNERGDAGCVPAEVLSAYDAKVREADRVDTKAMRQLTTRAASDIAEAIRRDDPDMFAAGIRDVFQAAESIAPEVHKRFAVTDAADVVGNDASLRKQWDAAAGDAHDALFRLVAIQESIADSVEDLSFTGTNGDADERQGEIDQRETDAQPIVDLELREALETAEAAEDCTIPDWAV